MTIVCPHCATSYAVDPFAFGPDGRAVRCARCKEVWTAFPEQADRALAYAEASPRAAMTALRDDAMAPELAPEIMSPSIAGDWPEDAPSAPESIAVHAAMRDAVIDGDAVATSAAPGIRRAAAGRRKPARFAVKSLFGLPAACAAMAALLAGLMIWRADMVRLMPQTAAFYRYTGLPVNLRGLDFQDVAAALDTIDGKPVLAIEGAIANAVRRPVELPRLRLILRDGKGTEIYGWNAVLEQPGLNPGGRVPFRAQLAAPPAEARALDVRFLTKRDLAGGGA